MLVKGYSASSQSLDVIIEFRSSQILKNWCVFFFLVFVFKRKDIDSVSIMFGEHVYGTLSKLIVPPLPPGSLTRDGTRRYSSERGQSQEVALTSLCTTKSYHFCLPSLFR